MLTQKVLRVKIQSGEHSSVSLPYICGVKHNREAVLTRFCLYYYIDCQKVVSFSSCYCTEIEPLIADTYMISSS